MARGSGLSVDASEFLSGLGAALKEMDVDAGVILNEVGDQVVNRARSAVPKASGQLAGSIHGTPGRDQDGPWIDVGTSLDYGFFVEFGTYKMRARPYLRPALSMAARGIATAGGRAKRSGKRGQLVTKRAGKRGLVRRAYRKGQISASEARSLSREVSQRFQYRGERRRGR
jgi:bacteriophage HK97-gp10 putative tail-component